MASAISRCVDPAALLSAMTRRISLVIWSLVPTGNTLAHSAKPSQGVLEPPAMARQ